MWELESNLQKLMKGVEELIAYGLPKHIEDGLKKVLEEVKQASHGFNPNRKGEMR